MKAYELLYFTSPSIEDEAREGVMKRIESTITQSGGTVDNVDEWGKRKLSYEIDGLSEGDYTLIDFHMEPQDTSELERVLRITDGIVRSKIVSRCDRD